MARSSIGVYLMVKDTGAEYKKVVDIKSAPGIIPDKDLLDASTLSDHIQKQIEGRAQAGSGFEFPFNYTGAEYKNMQDSYEGKSLDYSLWIGDEQQSDGSFKPTGADGKFNFKATMSLSMSEVSDNSVMEAKVVLLPETLPVFTLD